MSGFVGDKSAAYEHELQSEYSAGGGSANPYAAPRLSTRHSRSRSDDDDEALPSDSSSPFAGLLNHRQPYAKLIPRHAQWRYRLRTALSSIRPAHIFRLLLYLIPGLAVSLVILFTFYEPKIEIKLYSRKWLQAEVDPIPPLSGCFEQAGRDGSLYNVTERVWRKTSTWEVQSGMDMQSGLDCYDYAGIIGGRPTNNDDTPLEGDKRTIYHTYWRIDLATFGPRQEYMLKSFFATQPVNKMKLVLWSNGDLKAGNAILLGYLRQYPEAFDVREVDMKALARGTSLYGSDRLESTDAKAWLDGDLLRLLVLWNYGGVWVDMDSLLTRSLEPLLEHEFVTQWDCYNKPYTPLNGALMRFHKHSPYLCEAFHIMVTDTAPRPGSTDWGSLLYTKLWRRLVKAGVPPFKILPWCFSDGRSCRIDNRLPDPFRRDGEGEGRWSPKTSKTSTGASSDASRPSNSAARVMTTEDGGLLDELLHKVFVVHLHNQWEKAFPRDGWVERLLLKRYEKKLDAAVGG